MEIILAPGRAEKNYWGDLWRYRELFYILVWRDLAVRYKQTAIGIAWAVLRPLIAIAVFTVLFGKVAHLPAPGAIPYPLLVCAGTLPWQFFSSALSESSNSLVSNTALIAKVYFPRLIIPAGAVITSLVDLLISFVILVGLFLWTRFCPDWRILTLPLFILLAFGAALGAGLWLCALTVRYRDFRYVVPFIVQFGFFISPVGMDSGLIPEGWRLLYSLNPMVGVIDGFRWALLCGQAELYWPGLIASILFTSLLIIGGLWYFRRVERTFADVI
jgi:lipopolysaccharide transport system permease protein